jgi:hypothetical protein
MSQPQSLLDTVREGGRFSCFAETGCEDMDWILLVQDLVHCRIVVNTGSLNEEEFLGQLGDYQRYFWFCSARKLKSLVLIKL